MDDDRPDPGPAMPPPPLDASAGGRPATGPPLRSPGFGGPRRQAGPADEGMLPGVLVLGGGLLVILGVFLPWLQASGPGGATSQNGIAIGSYGTLILGGFAAARGFSMVRPGALGFQMGTPLIGGVLILVFLAIRWGSLQQAIRDTEALSPLVHASIGIGVWATIVGAVAILVGGLLSRRPQQRH